MRRALPWCGLLLFAASFCWLLLTPRRTELPVERTLPRSRPPETPLSLIVFDPGHGGNDSGAICGGVLEKDLALDVARRAAEIARSTGFDVMATRDDDRYVSLAERAAIANRQRGCIFISIHFNDGKRPAVSGVETYFAAHQSAAPPSVWSWLPFVQQASSEGFEAESQSLASCIQEELVVHTQAVDRGTKPEQFFVIANVRHPAVLVEGGFLTSKADMAKLLNGEYRQKIAVAIVGGAARYREFVQHNQPTLASAARDSE
jgi:N-acetylmuramoyl-L-alanine amidase